MTSLVSYEHADGVARIAMNDGKVNAMSLAMLEALHAAFDRAREDRAIVHFASSREGIFSAGFDLRVFVSGDVAASVAMVRAGAELALKLYSFPRPILAVCAGHAYPMGAFLLLASDLRLGVDGPYRLGFNEVTIGIAIPSFALELARSRMHPAWLHRTATTGEMFTPREAVDAGILDRLVSAPELDSAIDAALTSLKRVQALPHAQVKERLRGATWARMRSLIDDELTVEAFSRLQR